jgi:predicted TIM-barrel fold metal-dependent hydrolase
MPPSLVNNSCDADYLIAEMDYAGVDRAVLQNDHFYGSLNSLFADAVRRYPHRFLATAHIDETLIADQRAIESLQHAYNVQGLHGIFYDSRTYWSGLDSDAVDKPRFRAFWQEVERLGLVTYWVPGGPLRSGLTGYTGQLRRWLNLLHQFPDLMMVIPGGLPTKLLTTCQNPLPREVHELAQSDNVCFEICYPIVVGGVEEYPYASALELVRYLYNECGPKALAWGSDVPNVLRHCTYSQSLEYVRRHTQYMPSDDLASILGGNLARFFGLSKEEEEIPDHAR